ncbi:MAG: hypothetical protein R6W72_09855 [Desulfurivibrionaceae bacterium]
MMESGSVKDKKAETITAPQAADLCLAPYCQDPSVGQIPANPNGDKLHTRILSAALLIGNPHSTLIISISDPTTTAPRRINRSETFGPVAAKTSVPSRSPFPLPVPIQAISLSMHRFAVGGKGWV